VPSARHPFDKRALSTFPYSIFTNVFLTRSYPYCCRDAQEQHP